MSSTILAIPPAPPTILVDGVSGNVTILTANIQGPPGGTLGTITLTGDTTGTGSGGTVPTENVGLLNHPLPSLTTGFLQWSGAAWTLAAITSAQLPTIALTGDVTGSASGGSIATTLAAIDGHTLPAPSGTNTVLQWSGSALSWATTAATSVTGTGLWYSASSTLNSAAVTLTGDVSQGALSGSNVPLTVTGLKGSVLPALSAGFLQYTGSAWSLAAITSAQLPTITLTGQVTGSASGGSIATTLTSANLPAITLTSDTTGGPTTGGSIATTTVSARSGGYLFGSSGSITWLSSYAANLIQTSVTTTPAANFTITPQQTTNSNATNGSFVLALAAPSGTGVEAALVITRGGTQVIALGTQPSGNAALNALWLSVATPSTTNYTIRSDGTDTHINAQSGAGLVYTLVGGSTFVSAASSSGIQFFSSTPSFGGGVGVVGLTAATTQPTSNPSAGGAIVYSTASPFAQGQGGLIVRGARGGVVNIAAAGSSSTVNGQTQGVDAIFGTCETVSSTSATTIFTYGTVSNVAGSMLIFVVGRALTSGTNVTVGAAVGGCAMMGWKNISGTVTATAAPAELMSFSTDTGLSAPTITASASGSVITVTVISGGSSAGSVTIAYQAYVYPINIC